MQSKLLSFKEIKKKYLPYSITLTSGSFDPFNEYYFRLLRWGAKQGPPFVVIIQKDDMTFIRRGFAPLSTTYKTRVEIISSLEFVDGVVIANRTAHDPKIVRELKPKVIVLQNDTTSYRKIIAKNITQIDPRIKVKIVPFRTTDFSKVVYNLQVFSNNQIAQKLLSLAKQSKGTISRISAILTDERNRILVQKTNSIKEEHAEILIFKNRKIEKRKLIKCSLYVLIPPCLMCAKMLIKSKIRKVFYLFPYGDMEGVKLLRKNGIIVERLK